MGPRPRWEVSAPPSRFLGENQSPTSPGCRGLGVGTRDPKDPRHRPQLPRHGIRPHTPGNACEDQSRSWLRTHIPLSVTSQGADGLCLAQLALLFSRSSTAPHKARVAQGLTGEEPWQRLPNKPPSQEAVRWVPPSQLELQAQRGWVPCLPRATGCQP